MYIYIYIYIYMCYTSTFKCITYVHYIYTLCNYVTSKGCTIDVHGRCLPLYFVCIFKFVIHVCHMYILYLYCIYECKQAVQLMFMRHGKSFSQDEIKSVFSLSRFLSFSLSLFVSVSLSLSLSMFPLCMCACVHSCAFVILLCFCVCVYIYMCIHTCIYVYMYICIYIITCIYIRIYIYKYIDIYVYIYTYK